jgi:hypothetical protein
MKAPDHHPYLTEGDLRDAADRCEREGTLESARAVAERVRRERCLVARAVAGGVDLDVREGVDDGKWGVHVIGRGCGAEHHADNVPAAEVPATLARMLGEVGA